MRRSLARPFVAIRDFSDSSSYKVDEVVSRGSAVPRGSWACATVPPSVREALIFLLPSGSAATRSPSAPRGAVFRASVPSTDKVNYEM